MYDIAEPDKRALEKHIEHIMVGYICELPE